MNNVYLCNAFSLQMTPVGIGESVNLKISRITLEEARELLTSNGGFVPAIGHPDTARIAENLLGIENKCNRISVKLEEHDIAVVFQVVGGRLPEGCTELPDGIELQWYKAVPHK